MKIKNSQYTKMRLLEEWALDILSSFARYTSEPIVPPIPTRQIAEKMLALKLDLELFKGQAAKTSAIIVPSKRWILLNEIKSLKKLRFSETHEIAHWLIEGFDEFKSDEEKVKTSIFRRRADAKEREFYVNYFAGALLMPLPLLLKLRDDWGADLYKYIDELSELFNVSRLEVRRRLSLIDMVSPFIDFKDNEIPSYFILPQTPLSRNKSQLKYTLIIPPEKYLDHRFTRLVSQAKKSVRKVYVVLNRSNFWQNISLCEFDLIDGFVWVNSLDEKILLQLKGLPEVECHDLSMYDKYINKLESNQNTNLSSEPFIAFTNDETGSPIPNKQLSLHSLNTQVESRVKLNTRTDTKKFVAQCKANGKSVVIVTGCFDLLTNAHIQFFHKAKKQGDILVVGVENDNRIKKFKGKFRPVNTASQRIEVLNELRCIDFTFVIHGSPNFEIKPFYTRLHKVIGADILVVTEGDSHLDDRREEIEKAGGKLIIVSKSDEVHSSSVLRKFLDETVLSDIVFVNKRTLYQLKKTTDSPWKQQQLPISLLDS